MLDLLIPSCFVLWEWRYRKPRAKHRLDLEAQNQANESTAINMGDMNTESPSTDGANTPDSNATTENTTNQISQGIRC
jgi:hypothetical protein